MLERGTLAILVLSWGSACFAVGATVVGWLGSLLCRPYLEDEEDTLDIMVRMTMSLTCLAGGFMEASALTSDEILFAVILNTVGLDTVLALAYSIGPNKRKQSLV